MFTTTKSLILPRGSIGPHANVELSVLGSAEGGTRYLSHKGSGSALAGACGPCFTFFRGTLLSPSRHGAACYKTLEALFQARHVADPTTSFISLTEALQWPPILLQVKPETGVPKQSPSISLCLLLLQLLPHSLLLTLGLLIFSNTPGTFPSQGLCPGCPLPAFSSLRHPQCYMPPL